MRHLVERPHAGPGRGILIAVAAGMLFWTMLIVIVLWGLS